MQNLVLRNRNGYAVFDQLSLIANSLVSVIGSVDYKYNLKRKYFPLKKCFDACHYFYSWITKPKIFLGQDDNLSLG